MSERTEERTAASDEGVDVGDVDGGDLGDLDGSDGQVGFDEDELGVDVEGLTGEPAPAPESGGEGGDSGSSGPGLLSRLSPSGLLSGLKPSVGLPNPLAGLPSGRETLVAFVVVVGSMVAGTMVPIPFLGSAAGLLGVFAGSFALGLLSGKSRYLELAAAGAVSAAAAMVMEVLVLSVVGGFAGPVAAFGAVSGLLAAVLGHYFGRDLRSGLTRDVE